MQVSCELNDVQQKDKVTVFARVGVYDRIAASRGMTVRSNVCILRRNAGGFEWLYDTVYFPGNV